LVGQENIKNGGRMMSEYLCSMYYQFKVDAKNEEEAWEKAQEQLTIMEIESFMEIKIKKEEDDE
jgi:hypothetical protein